MIKSTITTLTLTAGLSGLLVLTPPQPTPPVASPPEALPPEVSPPDAPMPDMIPEAPLPSDMPTAPAPLVDAEPVAVPAPTAFALAGPDVQPPRRTAIGRTARQENAELILQEFKHLRQAWEESKSTYERNEIESRLEELISKLESLVQAGSQSRGRSRSGGTGGIIARTPRPDTPPEARPDGWRGPRGIGSRSGGRGGIIARAPRPDTPPEARPETRPERRRGPRGIGVGVDSPPNAEREHEIQAELEAAMQKVRELEWEGRHDEAAAIRDRIQVAKERLAQGGAGRGRRAIGGTSRSDRPEKVKQQLEELLRKAEALAAQGEFEAAKEVHAKAQALATEAEAATAVRERRAKARGLGQGGGRARIRNADEVEERIGSMMRKAEEFAAQGEFESAKEFHAQAEALAAEARQAFAERQAQAQERDHARETRPERTRADRREPRPDRPVAPRSMRPPTLPDQLEDWQGKIEHMIIAAENLRAAGMNRQADGLIEEVQSLKVKMEESMNHRRKDRPEQRRDLAHEVDALRDEVKELRAIVHEMMARARSHSTGRD